MLKSGTTIQINCDADLEKVATFTDGKKRGRKGNMPDIKVAEDEFVSVVDSGSVVTGAKASEIFPKHQILPSDAQRRGVKYTSTSGGVLPNKGEVSAHMVSENGVELPDFRWQTC